MKLAIIGCGYVGSAVAQMWHQAGHDVTVTTTTPAKKQQLQAIATEVAVVTGRDLAGLQQVVSDREVVLLSVGSKERTPQGYCQAYLETAQNVVKAATSTGVKQLIYTSSYGILKENSGATIDETVEVKPQDEYGEILHQTEQTLLSVPKSEFISCILRLTGIYGPGRELIKIFRRVAGTTRPGEGDEYTNWVHLEDIVRAIDFARSERLRGIYNLNSDEFLTIKEFLDRLFTAHNLPPVTWDSTQPSTRAANIKLSNQKLKQAGFELVHPQIEFV